MKHKNILNIYTGLGLICGLNLSAIPMVEAAPGTFANVPLFLSTSAKPNVFFLVDDSGSMTQQFATDKDNAKADQGYTFFLDTTSTTVPQSTSNTTDTVWYKYVLVDGSSDEAPPPDLIAAAYTANSLTVPTSLTDKAWKARNPSFNKLYYNPDIDYIAWPDTSGTYSSATATGAFVDPLKQTTASTKLDLTSTTFTMSTNVPGIGTYPDLTKSKPDSVFYFYPATYWNDTKTKIEIKSTVSQCTAAQNWKTDACLKRAYADEIKNFANWFTYYRDRINTAKSSLGRIINGIGADLPDVRSGMITINDYNFKEIANMSTANKQTLLNELYKNVSTGGGKTTHYTPTLTGLFHAGSYFACDKTNFPSTFTNCPIEGMTGTSTKATIAANSAGECQQNFTILVTDGEYNQADSNITTNEDKHATTSTNPYDGDPYADGVSGTLADYAMYFYKQDFTPSTTDNRVPIICGVDENPAQHMVFYGITFGITGSLTTSNLPSHPRLNINNVCNGKTDTATAYSKWPANPTGGSSADKIDDLLHATFNARGGFYSAGSPKELTDSLTETLRDASSRRGASAAVGLSSIVNTTNTVAYISQFNSGSWFGTLAAYTLTSAGAPDVLQWDAAKGTWDNTNKKYVSTADYLDDASFAPANRTIITYNDDKSVTATGVVFSSSNWTNLSTNLTNDLMTDSSGTLEASNANGLLRADYLTGDKKCETAGNCSLLMRSRTSRLGDIINSTAVYVEKPIGNYPNTVPFPSTGGTNTYTDFKSGTEKSAFTSAKAANTRTPMVYVGANDGMLHAFNATTGIEEFAYIPSGVFSNTKTAGLHKLTETGYYHNSYVDLTPTIADAYITTPNSATQAWRTILVGGLRAGGQGVYALDITDPDSVIGQTRGSTTRQDAAKKMVMWEFTAADDSDMAYSFSQPVIVPVKTGPNDADYDWFVAFGNGYSNGNSTPGTAVLYLLKLSGPATGKKWTLGTDFFKINTNVGDGKTVFNGLSSPSLVDTDRNNLIDRAYAGDVLGNMWTFNLTVDGTTKALKPTLGYNLYATGQSITVKPTVIRNDRVTDTGYDPNMLVLFGTGQYLAANDQNDAAKYTFYGLWDNGKAFDSVKDQLIQQKFITGTTTDTTGATVQLRGIQATSVQYTPPTTPKATRGWYLTMSEAGERIISHAVVLGGTLVFTSVVPDANKPCSGGGHSWINAVSPFDGASSKIQVFDTNRDGTIDGKTDNIATFTSANSTVASMQLGVLITDSAFLTARDPGTNTTKPCPSGSAITYLGSSTDATNPNATICAEGGAGGKGRMSWRQIHIK